VFRKLEEPGSVGDGSGSALPQQMSPSLCLTVLIVISGRQSCHKTISYAEVFKETQEYCKILLITFITNSSKTRLTVSQHLSTNPSRQVSTRSPLMEHYLTIRVRFILTILDQKLTRSGTALALIAGYSLLVLKSFKWKRTPQHEPKPLRHSLRP
jgi:hypothetical protein